MLGRNPRHTRSVDDTTGGGSTTALFEFREVTDPREPEQQVFQVIVTTDDNVVRGWYDRFVMKLREVANTNEVLKRSYNPYSFSKYGRMVVVYSSKMEGVDFGQLVRDVAQTAIVAPPQLTIKTGQFEDDTNGTRTLRVFHDGSLETPYLFEGFKSPKGVRVYYDSSAAAVILTAPNPLYHDELSKPLVDKIRTRLQEYAVPEPAAAEEQQVLCITGVLRKKRRWPETCASTIGPPPTLSYPSILLISTTPNHSLLSVVYSRLDMVY